MNAKLEALKEAWDPGDPATKNLDPKRDLALARQIADEFVEENPELFASFREMSESDCVKALDVFRAAGMEEDVWRVQAWLFYRFEPKNIGGEVTAQVRIH